MENIGAYIKEHRIAKGMTQREVGLRVGVTEAAVSRWESGEIKDIRREKLANLAKCLDINPLILLGMDTETEKAPTPTWDERDVNLVSWFRSLPEEKQKAILASQDAPEGLV